MKSHAYTNEKQKAMIYLLEEDNFPMSEDKIYIFEVPEDANPELMYHNHMMKLAEELGIIINPNYYNAMGHVSHHKELSTWKYLDITTKWKRIKEENTLLDFMRSNFTEINYARL